MSKSNQINLLIGVTGSVAAIKLPLLIKQFKNQFKDQIKDKNLEIRIVVTENSLNFFDLNDLSEANVELYRDKHEWQNWKQIGDPILHIDLRNWADLLLISPLDANTLAKLANGLCDNLLTCIVRAWDIKNKAIFYAPAMNTFMYEHPLTGEHLNKLNELGYIEIPVICKKLACGDTGEFDFKEMRFYGLILEICNYLTTGKGAMEEYVKIVDIVIDRIKAISLN